MAFYISRALRAPGISHRCSPFHGTFTFRRYLLCARHHAKGSHITSQKLCFTSEETVVQRGYATCLKSELIDSRANIDSCFLVPSPALYHYTTLPHSLICLALLQVHTMSRWKAMRFSDLFMSIHCHLNKTQGPEEMGLETAVF